jgi:Putative prokaryotic signal transducing protein
MSTSPERQLEPEPVRIFDTHQESEAMVVHGLLMSAGIESVVANLGANQALWPGVGGVMVLVNARQAEEARRIIAEYNETPLEIEDVAGVDESAGE